MDRSFAAGHLKSALGLETPPIGIAFVTASPTDIVELTDAAPSACTFWRRAEQGVFYAAGSAHFNCPVGAMVMGFEMPGDVQQQLMAVANQMIGCGYVTEPELAKIPTDKRPKSGAVYGPLADLPIEPDVVMMWLSPRQAMLVAEAVGSCRWTENVPTTAFGRPACSALPIAIQSGQPTVSLGCAGMRTFTEISEDRLLVAVPGPHLNEFLGHLDAALEANQVMQQFYDGRKLELASA